MRLFVAFDIDEKIRGPIAQFVDSMKAFAPEARWVRAESLHVTLKFIGEKSEEEVKGIMQTLNSLAEKNFELTLRGYGFFPGMRTARVFWIGIEAGPELGDLAASVDATLASIAIPREGHSFTPHLTLARLKGESGAPRRNSNDRESRTFQRLQQNLAASATPEFGVMTVRHFFLYQSELSRDGSNYKKLARFALR